MIPMISFIFLRYTHDTCVPVCVVLAPNCSCVKGWLILHGQTDTQTHTSTHCALCEYCPLRASPSHGAGSVVAIVTRSSCCFMYIQYKNKTNWVCVSVGAGSPRKWGLDVFWAERQSGHQILLRLWEHCGKDCNETVCQQYQKGVCAVTHPVHVQVSYAFSMYAQKQWLTTDGAVA